MGLDAGGTLAHKGHRTDLTNVRERHARNGTRCAALRGMRLHWSPRSPFVRKVMVAAHELGLVDRIETVRTVVRMGKPNEALLPDNPLSKIPTLVLDDGQVLFDSLTIIEYLDSFAGGRLVPGSGPARWQALTRHALGNGFLDLLILWRNERDKPEPARTAEWLASFATKARATLDHAVTDGRVIPIQARKIARVLDEAAWSRTAPRSEVEQA